MSEVAKIDTDFEPNELAKLEEFVEAGKPGIAKIDAKDEHAMFRLYMEGCSYSEVSMRLNIKKPIVLYFARRDQWFEKKNRHYQELTQNLDAKLAIAKLEGISFMTEIINFWQDWYRKKMADYRSTKNEIIPETMDLKPLAALIKAHETLQKLHGSTSDSARPINVNVPAGSEITQNASGVTVSTPAPKPNIAEAMRLLTELHRQKELSEIKKKDNS
jgi:hypothetical protein